MSEAKPKRRFVVQVTDSTFLGITAEHWRASVADLWFYNDQPGGEYKLVGTFNPTVWRLCWELNDDEDWPDFVLFWERGKLSND